MPDGKFNSPWIWAYRSTTASSEASVSFPAKASSAHLISKSVTFVSALSRFPGAEAKEVPAFIYELFPVLLQMKHRRGGDLSGGQQQQLAIGRALASRPRLLILDEPTEGIQPSVIKEIGVVIRKLAERGDMAILLVEQFYDFAAELADQYLVMSRGEIVQQGRGETMEADGVRGLVAI